MFAVIYIPDFSLQSALRLEPGSPARPIALIDDQQPKAAIFQLTSAARAAGVKEGMTSTQALARCGDIIIRTRSLSQESAASDALLQCAYRFSPRLEATGPGICTLDLQGLPVAVAAGPRANSRNKEPQRQPEDAVAKSCASLEKWSQQIIHCLAQLHLRAQVGVAENPNLSLHAARCARPFLAVQNSTAFLAALPIESIEPSAELLSILTKWGIRTLGEFTSLDKDRIAERLEAGGVELFERASAHTIRPLKLVNPRETFEETIDFDQAIESLEPLLLILRRFLDQISCRLELAGFVAEELQLRLRLSSGQNYERFFSVPAPTGNVETLFRMLHTHLENVRTDSPIMAVNLSARPCRPENQQFGLFESALRDPNQFYETVARLTGLLEARRVGTPVVEPTHRPDAFHLEPVNSVEAASDRRWNKENQRRPEAAALTRGPASGGRLRGLPLRRFRPPQRVQVLVLDERPTLFRAGNWIKPLKQAKGPWRSSGHWWDNQCWNRDEWDVETIHGEIYRLFCQNNDWFLEGVFD
jgi:protein ImuB